MRLIPRLRIALFGLALISACSSKGCSCVQPIKGGFPIGERHPNAIQLRATQSMLQFLSANGPALIPKLLPNGSMFNIPPSCGTNQICCGNPAPMCRISFNFQSLSLLPQPASTLQLSTNLELKTVDNLPVKFAGVTCVVSIDTTRAGATTMNVASSLGFNINTNSKLTELHATNTKVTGIDDGDVKLDEPGSTFLLCSLAGLPGVKGFIIGQIEAQVATQIQTTVDNQQCLKCADATDCPPFAADCKGGLCVDSDLKTCMQEVGIDGRVNAAALLARFSPGTQAKLDLLAALGGYAQANTGLSLGMLGGAFADPHSPCVPIAATPPAVTVAQSATFDSDVMPDQITPYHLGIGVHVSHLNDIGFGAWDSGALCLDIGAAQVSQLNGRTFGVVLPSLADLTHGGNAPMFLAIRPSAPPAITLGLGTFRVDPQTGAKTVDDPLLHVSVPGFGIDFYAFVDDRYVRIMTLHTDLTLGLSLDVDGQGRIVPLLGDLKSAFANVTVTNSQLLSESPADLAQAFPSLLAIAIGQLTSAIPPISLPALMGLQVTPLAIQSTDPNATGQNEFLSIFANVMLATPESLGADTTARLVALTLPPTRGFAVGARASGAEPTATFELGGRPVAGQPLEWSWALDDGPWSPYSSSSTLTLTHPLLWLQGRHHLDVRARALSQPVTTDLTPARVELLVDTVAPTGELVPDGSDLVVTAEDNVSAVDQLEVRFRIGGAARGAWSHERRLIGANQASPVIAEVRDEAGNVAELDFFHGRTTAPPASGCGCRVGASTPLSACGALALSGLLLALLLRRRLAWLLVAAGLGCNSPVATLGTSDLEPPTDEAGRYSDVVARSGVFYVSAYDDTYGDLAYTHFSLGQTPVWQAVDGIDPAAKPDKPGGFRGGISDPGPDVGLYTSLALTHGGDPRIAYYDLTHHALKFAAGPGHFQTHTVQASQGVVDVGRFAALSLDSHDVPTIAFMATNLGDGMNGFYSELRVAVAKSSQPGAASDWTIQVVDTMRIKCAGLCATGQSCVQAQMVNGMPNGDPSFSTCVTAGSCTPACTASQACVAGKCATALATPKATDLPEGTGLFTRILRGPGDAITLVYYDHSQGDLKVARAMPGGMFAVTILDGNDPTTDVGQFVAAALAQDGTLHVAYVDAIRDQLLYQKVSGGAALPNPEVIDDGMRDDGPHPVGAGAALILDGTTPRVAYQDQQTGNLLQSARSPIWTHQPVDTGNAAYGWFTHLVADGGKIYVSQFVYDRANPAPQPFGRLHVDPLP